MKRRTEKRMTWAVAAILVAQVAMVIVWFVLRPGHRDLFENNSLTLVTDAAPGTELPHAHAELRGASMRVHGRIKAEAGATASEQDGTMLVVIVLPDKSEQSRVTGPYHLSAKLPKGGGSFSVELPLVPPKGSIVKISWKPAKEQSHGRPVSGARDS